MQAIEYRGFQIEQDEHGQFWATAGVGTVIIGPRRTDSDIRHDVDLELDEPVTATKEMLRRIRGRR